MIYRIAAVVSVLALSAGVGVSMGNATVAQMQIRAHPDDDRNGPSERAFDRGVRWAHSHRIFRSDLCPDTDQYFLSGCIAATSSDG